MARSVGRASRRPVDLFSLATYTDAYIHPSIHVVLRCLACVEAYYCINHDLYRQSINKDFLISQRMDWMTVCVFVCLCGLVGHMTTGRPGPARLSSMPNRSWTDRQTDGSSFSLPPSPLVFSSIVRVFQCRPFSNQPTDGWMDGWNLSIISRCDG